MKLKTYVYGLCDPHNGIIHYVGTTRDIRQRIAHHSNPQPYEANKKLHAWVLSLKPYLPGIVILDVVGDSEDRSKLEKFYINSLRDAGFPLLNITWIG